MKASTLILVVLWINLFLASGCMNRAPSLRMLDARAEYEDPRAVGQSLVLKEAGVEGFRSGPVPVRTRPKVAAIWIHPHEMASHDYFWGGWMAVVVEPDQWLLTKPEMMPKAPGVVDASRKQGAEALREKSPRSGADSGKRVKVSY